MCILKALDAAFEDFVVASRKGVRGVYAAYRGLGMGETHWDG